MRQDPPFDLGYITATHLLERIASETLVVNDPAAVRNAPEKLWVLDFAQFMPPTCHYALARRLPASFSPSMARSSSSRCMALPAARCSGSALMVEISPSLIELFNSTYREPHVLQKFLPEIAEGDKRIVLVDGKVAGAINRVPGQGEIRSNLAVGGTAAKTRADGRREGDLRGARARITKRGLLFVGIDVIGGRWLTEINVTSPTGIVAIDKFNGTDTPASHLECDRATLDGQLISAASDGKRSVFHRLSC